MNNGQACFIKRVNDIAAPTQLLPTTRTLKAMDIFNDEELQAVNPRWNPDEWISRGRSHHDVPRHVNLELARLQVIPIMYRDLLPPDAHSPAQFYLNFASTDRLPPWNTAQTTELDNPEALDFSEMPPTFIPKSTNITAIEIPSFATILRLENTIGQAWLDGATSIRDSRTPEIQYLPLWYLTAMRSFWHACKSANIWGNAFVWLHDGSSDAEEEVLRSRAMACASAVVGWHGPAKTVSDDVQFEFVAEILGDNYLYASIVDMLLDLLAARLEQRDGHGGAIRIAGTTFASVISNGAYEKPSPAIPFRACLINFRNGRVRFGDPLGRPPPRAFAHHLKIWLEQNFPIKVVVTNDLPCAVQTDGFNCPVIAVNTLASNIFGDALWTEETARAHRIRAFCVIMESIALSQEGGSSAAPGLVDLESDRNVNNLTVISDALPSTTVNPDTNAMDVDNPVEPSAQIVLDNARAGAKRQEPDTKNDPSDSRPSKRAKSTNSKPFTRVQIKASDSKRDKEERKARPKPKVKEAEKEKEAKKTRVKAADLKPAIPDFLLDPGPGGMSISSQNTRKMRQQVIAGVFQGSHVKSEKLRVKCSENGGDPDVRVLINDPFKAICSRCEKPIPLKGPYEPKRFRDHWLADKCNPPVKFKPAQTLDLYIAPIAVTEPSAPPPPPTIKQCPGLTRNYLSAIGDYLDTSGAAGGGAEHINKYAQRLYGGQFPGLTSITDERLTALQKARVRTAQALDRKWRNDTSPDVMAVFSVQCSRQFTVKKLSDITDARIQETGGNASTLKFTPKMYANPTQAKLFAKREGLESFLHDDSKVFLGLVEAMILGTEREIRGVGMKNFKYQPEFREWAELVRMISPRLYRNMAQQFRMETQRSIKNRESKRPRYPLGIQPETYEYAAKYCKDYGYPPSHPLVLSVDDTKLFATMQPLFDGPSKKWYLVGCPGEQQILIPDIDALDAMMKEKHTPATKLRLWALQIPLPGIPPLALAILPISSTIKAPELAQYQIKLARGLIKNGFRFISNASDGAAIERDCQRRLAAVGTTQEYILRSPCEDEPHVKIALNNLDGNVYMNIQDAPHARKTGRNNMSTGARGLIIGDYTVHFDQLCEIAFIPDSPLYQRDVIRADRQDDNAATRIFSAATLQAAARLSEQNMGLTSFYAHDERVKVALRARLFFKTWRMFLRKQGYSEARHYISQAASDIFEILIDGIIGLIIIHREHLSRGDIPLLLWKHVSMGDERLFAAMREIAPDFTLMQAIVMMPHLRATMRASSIARFAKAGFKMVANGYQFDDLLPDTRMTEMYAVAMEENSALWALVNVHIPTSLRCSRHTYEPFPLDLSPEGNFLSEDDIVTEPEAAILDLSIREELQAAIDAIAETTDLTSAESEERDACLYAAASLLIENLAYIDNLPEIEDPAQLELGASKDDGDAAVIPVSLTDVTATELDPLVQIRQLHQTEKARTGVRNYKAPNTTKSTAKESRNVEKPLSPEQELSRRVQMIVRQAQERGSSTGLNRQNRWKEGKEDGKDGKETAVPSNGNAANAAAAAEVRASSANRRRRELSAGLGAKCKSLFTDGGITPQTPLGKGDFVFVLDRNGTILLAKVIAMYSKGGGKAGKHNSVYESAHRRTFKRIHRRYALMGNSRFMHTASGSVLARATGVSKETSETVEISKMAVEAFTELGAEKVKLTKIVATLNTVRRKGWLENADKFGPETPSKNGDKFGLHGQISKRPLRTINTGPTGTELRRKDNASRMMQLPLSPDFLAFCLLGFSNSAPACSRFKDCAEMLIEVNEYEAFILSIQSRLRDDQNFIARNVTYLCLRCNPGDYIPLTSIQYILCPCTGVRYLASYLPTPHMEYSLALRYDYLTLYQADAHNGAFISPTTTHLRIPYRPWEDRPHVMENLFETCPRLTHLLLEMTVEWDEVLTPSWADQLLKDLLDDAPSSFHVLVIDLEGPENVKDEYRGFPEGQATTLDASVSYFVQTVDDPRLVAISSDIRFVNVKSSTYFGRSGRKQWPEGDLEAWGFAEQCLTSMERRAKVEEDTRNGD
ncbi:hypothetical protein BDZ89DRAFT_1116955 [Hymenopellis radicata]|nr:hypothetical protein BDZ89DRAFT_1116955 [Hymenopellis radicata]